MEESEYIHYIQKKYPYLDYEDIHMTYKMAKESLINALFPFQDDQNEVPEKYEMKLLEVMMEIVDSGNMRHFTSYSENGVSWTKSSSTSLESLKDVTPYAG